jgi:hypothetical protein
MVELNKQIARLELRCEQFVIHLRSIDRHCIDARHGRSDLYAMLQELVELKGQREQLEASQGLAEAA